MHLGLVLAQPPEYSETFFYSKIEGLQKNGIEVSLFCQRDREDFSLCPVYVGPRLYSNPVFQVFAMLQVYLRLISYYSVVHRFYQLEKKEGTSKVKILKKIYLNSHLFKAKLDWLHFGFGTMALERELIPKALGAKMAVSFRGFDIGIYPIKYPNCYQLLWKNLDKLHVISEDLHQKAIEQGLPKIIPVQKITPAIDVDFFSSDSSSNYTSNTVKFITVGRLHWKKAYVETLQALALVKNKGVAIEYKVIGEGQEYERIAFAAHELGLGECISFLGKQTKEEVKKHVQNADIYLQYSIQEGFCNAVLEAQALGKLCVVSDAEGLSENVQHEETGWVVPKLSAEQLADKIMEVIHLPEEVKRKFSQQAIQRVREKFTIEQQQQAFVEFYKVV